MGYFANGDAGDWYQATYCARCIHDVASGCAVWLAHLIHNYAECNKPDSALHLLIPREGVQNLQCAMFIPRRPSAETKVHMARQTQIDKKIAEIDKQISFLVAVRDALYDAQGKGRTTPAVTAPTPRKKKAPAPAPDALAEVGL